ncbi:MAG: hypothetical protein RIR18_108, partial [Pseudomonadota bacterium]
MFDIDSGVLSVVVFLATSLIAVVAIIFSYLAKSETSERRYSILVGGFLVVSWCLISWYGSHYYIHTNVLKIVESLNVHSETTISQLGEELNEKLRLVSNLPKFLAEEEMVVNSLSRRQLKDFVGKGDVGSDKEYLENLPEVVKLSRKLNSASKQLDVAPVWVMNTHGMDIGASNVGTETSFIGTNYSQRQYFKESIEGQLSTHYAIGKITKVPGLFFSAPVYVSEHVAGVLAVKFDIPNFRRLLANFNAVLADANGVVIVSSLKELEGYTLPESGAKRLPPELLKSIYGKTSFQEFQLSQLGENNKPYLIFKSESNHRYLYREMKLQSTGLKLITLLPLTEVEAVENSFGMVFSLILFGGALFLASFLSLVLYMRALAHSKQQAELAREAAELANKSKSTFLATMSHEIRTPLNGILGMAQILSADEISNHERIDFTKTILDSGNTLLTLLNDILDLSKIEAGKIDLEFRPSLPAEIVKDISSLFLELANSRGIALSYHSLVDENIPFLLDTVRIRQMLSNLVGNAIKFTSSGYVLVEVAVVGNHSGMSVLEFSVTDTGIGIPKEKIGLLFQPFSQADGSTTRKFGGTGLGLSIVRMLAELMGGEVGVSSEQQGSRFWFRVQAKAADPSMHVDIAPTPTQTLPRIDKGAEVDNQHRCDALIVDDNLINQKVIESA